LVAERVSKRDSKSLISPNPSAISKIDSKYRW
jgi:hypothetical protein